MKDRVTLDIAGFSAATVVALGVMLHQAMNVEATARADAVPIHLPTDLLLIQFSSN